MTAFRLVIGQAVLVGSMLVGCSATAPERRLDPAPEEVVTRAADWVLREWPGPVPFNWGEGVLMAGMMRAGQATGDNRYAAYVRTWADHWNTKDLPAALADPKSQGLWGMPGYCGLWGPGFALTMLHERTGDPSYLAMARHITDFMTARASRTADGGLAHWQGNRQLWVDTLDMSCPVYANVGRLVKRPELIAEAARQLDISAGHLQDADTGLFYHMYDEETGKHSPEFWGRGNGWTMMAYVETLCNLDPKSPAYDRAVDQFRRLVEGVMPLQDGATGLWRTVLNRPDSYLETSASAMILYSLVEAERLEIIKLDTQLVEKAWAGLASKVDDDGKVFDVSAGTGPTTFEKYVAIGRGTETWGTGALLLAASALMAN
jgi:rhamnogalacturonyl hydrolase YesR